MRIFQSYGKIRFPRSLLQDRFPLLFYLVLLHSDSLLKASKPPKKSHYINTDQHIIAHFHNTEGQGNACRRKGLSVYHSNWKDWQRCVGHIVFLQELKIYTETCWRYCLVTKWWRCMKNIGVQIYLNHFLKCRREFSFSYIFCFIVRLISPYCLSSKTVVPVLPLSGWK